MNGCRKELRKRKGKGGKKIKLKGKAKEDESEKTRDETKYEKEKIESRRRTKRSWLKHYATSRKAAGSRPDEVNAFFQFT